MVSAGILLAGSAALAGASAASAADYDYPAAIEPGSIKVTNVGGGTETVVDDQLRVDAGWTLPDGATAGQTFGFTMPPEFAGYTSSFGIPSKEDPTQMVAECVVSEDASPVVTCTLTDYVEGRTGLSGELWFVVSADQETTEHTVEFVVDGKITTVPLPGEGIGPGGNLPEEPEKWSWQTADGRLAWQLLIPGASFADADPMIIDDTLTPPGNGFAEHRNVDGEIAVWTADASGENGQDVTGWTGGWDADGTSFHIEIPGPIDPTRHYLVKYYTVPTAPADGASFANTASVNGVTLQSTAVWKAVGGGSGTGTSTGSFSLAKVLSGTAAGRVPADTLYTVSYSYGDPVVRKTVQLKAGAASSPISLPNGTVVTVEEVAPPKITGVDWGVPAFSGTGVRNLGDGRAEITVSKDARVDLVLTNTATKTPVPVTPPPTTPETPKPPQSPPSELPLTPGLATTGGDVPLPLLWTGALVVGLGLVLSVTASIRRRRMSQD